MRAGRNSIPNVFGALRGQGRWGFSRTLSGGWVREADACSSRSKRESLARPKRARSVLTLLFLNDPVSSSLLLISPRIPELEAGSPWGRRRPDVLSRSFLLVAGGRLPRLGKGRSGGSPTPLLSLV